VSYSPTDGRVACTAVVTVTLEIQIGPQWKSHNLEEVYKQAAEDALRRVTDACKDFAVVKGPLQVRSILTQQQPVD
jgi:hypothetical protein